MAARRGNWKVTESQIEYSASLGLAVAPNMDYGLTDH